MSVRVVELTDDQEDLWQAYVAKQNAASFYHDYAWRKFYRERFGKQTFYLAAMTDDVCINGLLPLIRQKSLLFGDYLVSVPFFNYGGTIADSADVRASLIDAAVALAQQLGVSHLEFRESSEVEGMPVRKDKVSMILDLPNTADELGKQLGSKRRSQIRRPLRESPEILRGGVEQLDSFYQVFSRNMRDLGTPVYSKLMFEDILKRFSGHCEIVSIKVDGDPAAAAFLVHHRNTTEIPWASTVSKYNRISINMLMYWEALTCAIERGSEKFDFGRSTMDSGTFRFKKQWGASPRQLYWHYWLQDGTEIPGLNPGSGRYDAAIQVWKKLPLWITNMVGPRIVRNLP